MQTEKPAGVKGLVRHPGAGVKFCPPGQQVSTAASLIGLQRGVSASHIGPGVGRCLRSALGVDSRG